MGTGWKREIYEIRTFRHYSGIFQNFSLHNGAVKLKTRQDWTTFTVMLGWVSMAEEGVDGGLCSVGRAAQ